ncbi:TBC domain containing protein [Acanthamoeba castellanii str. Neff]|uniref:TBC domain containing protein n=1 Tax=Acanthamoeba castellanii (strain ATCC 30010 / Neff) TaxID=1257118 RepID=L8GN23_ACACF|nr:TBC domain containing protein [Acanthamoeba castellanii str. Neff]ELR14392.1 TBC domain containing protein [Acanthamoeba castellanii str. Neff]
METSGDELQIPEGWESILHVEHDGTIDAKMLLPPTIRKKSHRTRGNFRVASPMLGRATVSGGHSTTPGGRLSPPLTTEEAFLRAITNFDVRSKGDLEEDVAETIRLCLKRLLEHEDIRYGIAVSIDQYLISTSMLQKHLDAHKNLLTTSEQTTSSSSSSSSSTTTTASASSTSPVSTSPTSPVSTSPTSTTTSTTATEEVSPSSSPLSPRLDGSGGSGGWRAVRKKPHSLNRPHSEGTHPDDPLAWHHHHRPIDRTGMLTFRGLNVDELAKRFKRRRFNRAKEEEVLDKILETARETRSSGGAVEMEDVLRDLRLTRAMVSVVEILCGWEIDRAVCLKLVHGVVVTRKQKPTLSRKVSVLGLGKRLPPFWGNTLTCKAITTYCAIKQVYMQPMLGRLLNPDYYGRLGGACFYTLLLATKKTSNDKKNLLRFVLEWEFGKDRIGIDLRKLSGDAVSVGTIRRNHSNDNNGGGGGQLTSSDDVSIQIGVNARSLAASSVNVDLTGPAATGTVDASWLETELVGPWMSNFARSREAWNGEKHLVVKGDGRVSRERWNEDNAIILDDPPETHDLWRTEAEGTHRTHSHRCRQKPWNLYYQEIAQRPDFPHKIGRSKELKSIIRTHGILPDLRGKFWQGLSGANANKSLFSYQSILLNCNRETKHTVQIEKDLKRTFHGNEALGKSDEEGIAALRRVLTAYSCVNTDVGYCQSMNFICALLLLFMEEEDAFWMLMTLIEYLLPSDFYGSTMEGIIIYTQVFSSLLKTRLPRLSAHLDHLQTVLQVWDSLYYEGPYVLFRVALALFKINEAALLDTTDNADCFYMIKQLPQSVSKEELMAAVFAKGSTMRGLKADVGRLQAACRAASALDPHKRRASYSSADLNASSAASASAASSGGGVSPRRSTTHGQPAAAVATAALTSTEAAGAGPSLASLSSRLRTKAPIPTPTSTGGGDDTSASTSATSALAASTEEAPPPLPPKVWKPSSKSRIYSKTVDPHMYQSLRTRWLEQIEQRTKGPNAAGDGEAEADHTKSPPLSPSMESAGAGAAPPSPAFSDWIERLKTKSAADGSPSSGSRGRHQAEAEAEVVEAEAEAEKPKGSSVRVGLVSGHGFHKRTVIMQQRRKADEHKVLAQLHPQYAQTRYRLSFLIRANEDQGSEEYRQLMPQTRVLRPNGHSHRTQKELAQTFE